MPEPRNPRLWSHDALRWAHFELRLSDRTCSHIARLETDATGLRRLGESIAADRVEARVRQLAAGLEGEPVQPSLFLPEDDGELQMQPLDRATIAHWIYGLPVGINDGQLQAALGSARRLEAINRVVAALARSFQAELRKEGLASVHGRDGAAADYARERELLARVLAGGLEERLGRQLVGREECVFIQLAARGLSPPGICVCEVCRLVFEGKRARRCARCNRSPLRAQPKPHHRTVVLANRATEKQVRSTVVGNSLLASITVPRGPRQTTYFLTCRCGREFPATDARTELCPSCGSRQGRQRRYRERAAERLPIPNNTRGLDYSR